MKHCTYSGYDLSYVSHTLCYVCPLQTSYCTRLRSIYLRPGNFTVSYVHSQQVQKTCLRINYIRFLPQPWHGAALAPTMVCGMRTPKPSAYAPSLNAQTKCICAILTPWVMTIVLGLGIITPQPELYHAYSQAILRNFYFML